MVRYGMADTMLDRLTASIGAFERAMEEGKLARQARVAAPAAPAVPAPSSGEEVEPAA